MTATDAMVRVTGAVGDSSKDADVIIPTAVDVTGVTKEDGDGNHRAFDDGGNGGGWRQQCRVKKIESGGSVPTVRWHGVYCPLAYLTACQPV
jgi:hypothetical protein